jgi:hypothetical protein
MGAGSEEAGEALWQVLVRQMFPDMSLQEAKAFEPDD